jgi:hypothetical protein
MATAALITAHAAAAVAQTLPRQDELPAVSRLGAVSGIVVEKDGTPVPGVTIRLSGPAPRETEHRVVADQEGRFLFTQLRHGDYRIGIELPGLQAPVDIPVVVLPGQRIETSVVVSLFTYEVEVAVLARSADVPQVIDTDSTAERRELTNRELTRLPLPVEQALDALPIFPGVVRSPGGLISIGGTLPTDSAYLFNGADLMDPFTGEYRLRLPMEAVESMSLETGVSSADYADRLGGVVNVTTAEAGDNWDTEIASPFPRPWIRDGQFEGVRRFNPRVRVSGPFSPNVRFSQTFGYRFEREKVFDAPQERGDHTVVEQWQSLTQFDWKTGDRSNLRVMLLGSPEREAISGLSGLTPEEATSNIDHTTVALVVNQQQRLDDRSFLQSTLQFNRQATAVRPRTIPPGPAFDMFPDYNDGTAFSNQNRRSLHWQLKSTYNRVLGADRATHLLRAGFEIHQLTLRGRNSNGPIRIFDADGRLRRLIESVDLEDPTGEEQRGDKWEGAVFVQDRWKPSDRFWIDAGLRISHDSAVRGLRLAPRLGLAWDVGGNGRTLLKASAGIMHRRIFLAEQYWDLFPTRIETTFDENGNGSRVYLPARRQDELSSPRAFVWTLSATQRLGPRFTAHVAISERHSADLPVFDRIDHAPIPVVPGQSTSWFTAPPEAGLFLSSSGKSTSRQFEITANVRIGELDQLFISYVTSTASGDLNDFSLLASNHPEPVLRPNARGALRFDTPNRVVIWGTFHLPWDLIAAPSIEWRNGFPWSSLDVYRDYAAGAHDRRFPDYFSPDLQVTKGFRIRSIPVRAGILVTNFLFRANPRDVISVQDSPRFGEFLNKIPSRVRFRFYLTI